MTMAFWLGITGLVVFAVGVGANWRTIASGTGMEKLLALGRPLVAAALAAFGAEHLSGARLLMSGVPSWMPWPLFWTYLVGVALVATGLSLALGRMVRWSATLAGVMVLLFVAMIHLPHAVAVPGNRIFWTLVAREFAFAGGLWALAGAWDGEPGPRRPWMVTFGRIAVGAAAMVFGVEHMVWPASTPGIPLEKLTPAWVPWPHVWAAATGLLLVVCGAAMLLGRYARRAAALAGLWELVLTLALYVPILVLEPSVERVEGWNYVWDTALFAGTLLLVAAAIERPVARLAVMRRDAA